LSDSMPGTCSASARSATGLPMCGHGKARDLHDSGRHSLPGFLFMRWVLHCRAR
jgi:hypothetical protein